jgi:hypothetical protein
MEIHKHEPHGSNKTPIRPTTNWKTVPAYELAKRLTKILCKYLQLPNAYNIHYPIHLVTDLTIHGN